MSESKHTPGPWKIFHHDGVPLPDSSGHYDGYLKTEIRTDKGHGIYIRQSAAGKAFPELGANARLIAAAPSLGKALEELIEEVGRVIEDAKVEDSDLDRAYERARAALEGL